MDSCTICFSTTVVKQIKCRGSNLCLNTPRTAPTQPVLTQLMPASHNEYTVTLGAFFYFFLFWWLKTFGFVYFCPLIVCSGRSLTFLHWLSVSRSPTMTRTSVMSVTASPWIPTATREAVRDTTLVHDILKTLTAVTLLLESSVSLIFNWQFSQNYVER